MWTSKRSKSFELSDFETDWDARWQAIVDQAQRKVDPESSVREAEEAEEQAQTLMTKVTAIHTWFGGSPS